MTDRRTEILDSALHVLAGHGMRGLTHRAVDTAAAIPPGSTSYYFRSRSSLVAGCVQRLVDLDLQGDDAPPAPAGFETLVDRLTAAGVQMTTAQRHRTLARYELSLAAARDPGLRAALVQGGDTIRGRLAGLLAALGAVDPDPAAAEVAAALDGMLFTALLRGPREAEELAAVLRPALRRLLAAQPGVRTREVEAYR
jgi:AcrR family transcriptional regulator